MSEAVPHLDTGAIEEIARMAAQTVSPLQIGETHHVLVPEGWQRADVTDAVEKAAPHPSRKKGTLTALSIQSFIDMVNDQADEIARLYADPAAETLIAVLNDNTSDCAPAWRDHRIVYKAERSKEFTTWATHDRKPMEQTAFAEFLEDNIADIVEPSGDLLLKVATTLQAKTGVDFKSSKRLDNGQVQLTYIETVEARAGEGAIEIPREFAIGVRLFRNGEGYKLRARLKYRLVSGSVKFWYELDRPERALEEAFDAYLQQLQAAELTVWLARP